MPHYLFFFGITGWVLAAVAVAAPSSSAALAKSRMTDSTATVVTITNKENRQQTDEGKGGRPILVPGSFGYLQSQQLNVPSSTTRIKGRSRRSHRNFFSIGGQNDGNCVSNRRINCDFPMALKYRRIDGSCNNLKNTHWGQSGTPQRRLLPPKHSMMDCGKAAVSVPNARTTSHLLVSRKDSEHVLTTISMWLMVWGQVIDHDLVLTPVRSTNEGELLDCCHPFNSDAGDCCPIHLSQQDFFYSRSDRPKCMPLIRSRLASSCDGLEDVENVNTAWIDSSFLYGSDNDISDSLRQFQGGLLKTSVDRWGRVYPHLALSSNQPAKMNFGDSRNGVHPAFTLVITAFLRTHNNICRRLSLLRPSWSDNLIFFEARKIVSAMVQHITYTQFMDALLGPSNSITTEEKVHHDSYLPSVDPSISVVFSTAAFRLHTLVGGHFELRDPQFRLTSHLRLHDVFNDPFVISINQTYDYLIRGLAAQSINKFDNVFSSSMTEFLFQEQLKSFGLDIVSLSIQRGRDHQIQGYTQYREACGLGAVIDWENMTDLIDPDLVHRLQHVYSKPEDVELYIASSMETPMSGSLLGPTASCLVKEQFKRSRDGDRFFYTRPKEFTPDQLMAIKRVTLARILCDASDKPLKMLLPVNVFKEIKAQTNPLMPCHQHPSLDLLSWG